MQILQFLQNYGNIVEIFALFLSAGLGLFLFWRTARRELLDLQFIFDASAIFLLGTIFGRITDFIARFDYYNWSLAKLIFFNVYPGFDFYGAFFGGLLASALFLRNKKYNFWFVLDLAASSLAFGAFIYTILSLAYAKFLYKNGIFSSELVFLALGYFVIFWAIKRFEKKKRHQGFYACFFLILFSLLNLANNWFFGDKNIISYNYTLGLMSGVLVFSTISWYLLSKRKLNNDFKDFFAKAVLSVFKTRRILTNIREADNLARSIVLSPLYLAKLVYFLVKYVSREIYVSIVDLLSAFGVGK